MSDLEGFRKAWQEVADFLDIPAMAMSPADVHQSVLMPKLRWLRDRNADLRKALDEDAIRRVATEMHTCAHSFTKPTRKAVDVWAHDLFDAIGGSL